MTRKTLFALLFATTLASAQDRTPLGDFRKQFVNQRLVINQSFTDTPFSFLGGWQFVKEKKGNYTTDYGKEVPATLVGEAGVIVAVVAPSVLYGPPPSQTDETFVRYAEAIVRLDSGKLVETALYNMNTGTEVQDAFTLVSVREKHHQEAVALAQTLHGKSLYLSRLTHVYDTGLTTENIQTIKAGIGYSEARINDVPLLTPIPVIEVRYSEKLDFSMIVLQLPNDRKAFFVPGCVVDDLTSKTVTCASTSMPSFLSEREIEAIRKGNVFIGMSDNALYMTLGFPQQTNKAVIGSTQLVYRTTYIYLDAEKRVTEIQDH